MDQIHSLSPELKKRELLLKRNSYVSEVTIRNSFTVKKDISEIMSKKFNKHLNEQLKRIEDAEAK